jgi:cation diffusion facilitator family transporter
MHAETVDTFRHDHVFLGASHRRNERKTWIVIGVCATMMAAEIGGGALFGSMALVADGLHMSTHAGALLIAAFAYSFARRHARDERFSFGTGKFGELAAFTSAIVLAMIALLIGYESVQRFLHPVRIGFGEAIPIAVLGLGVNLLSAWLLRDDHGHGHGPAHDHPHDHPDHDHASHDHARQHRDLNLRAAYVHVMADAAVSVLAIVGLTSARLFGWVWMDPLMGVVGMVVILNWSFGLVRAAGAVLLDMQPDESLADAIEHRLEEGSDRVSDLHLWRVGPGHNAAVVSLVTDHPQPPEAYKAKLRAFPDLSHVTVEVHACPGDHAAVALA